MRDTELVKRYRNWLSGNTQAFPLFEKLANDIRNAGHTRYSAWALVQVMRFHSDLEQTESFKINNNYVALLARDLVEIDPSFEGFFVFRQTKRV